MTTEEKQEAVTEAQAGCPTWFTWSAFGASYPDTQCIDGFLWDLDKCDDDKQLYGGGDIPCPMCNPEMATDYFFGGGYKVPFWKHDNIRLPDGTKITYEEEGRSLKLTAKHPTDGQMPVVFIDMSEQDGFVESEFVDWVIAARNESN